MKKLTKKIMVMSLFAVVTSTSFAAKAAKDENSAPTGCRDSGYQFDLKTLELMPGYRDDNQSMYFLYNKANTAINLFQMRGEDSAHSAYLNHVIGARQWAVLSTNEKKVRFVCTVANSTSQYGDVIDCGQNIQVCEYTNVRYGLNNRGNYWLVNSNTKNSAINEVVHYGIIPGR